MRAELRRSVPLVVLFVLGLAAGIWVFASPWALGYPSPSGWSTSVWTSVWAGAVLTVAAAVSLVVLLARMVFVAQRSEQDAG